MVCHVPFYLHIYHVHLAFSFANYGGVPAKAEYCHEIVCFPTHHQLGLL